MAVILESKKIKLLTVSIVSPSTCHEVMGPEAMIFIFWMLSFKPTFSLSTYTFIRGFLVPLHFLTSCTYSIINPPNVFIKHLIFFFGLITNFQLSSVAQCVLLFATPRTADHHVSMSITNAQCLLKLMPIESLMPSNHLILCHPLLLPPSIIPSIRVFSNESVLRIRWPKYWSFSFNISPSSEHPGLISFRMDWLDLFEV